jgi:hypothetical protein
LYDEFKKLYHKYSSLKKKSCMFTCWKICIRKESMHCYWYKKLSYVSSHPLALIIDNLFRGTKTRASLRNINEHCAFVSHIEPKSNLEAKKKCKLDFSHARWAKSIWN